MSDALPELLDPRRAVASGAKFEGSLPLAKLRRLSDVLENDAGEAHYRLRFGRDEHGRGTVTGEIEAKLALRCQRCVGTFWLDVHAKPVLALVEGPDEAADLPEEYDPLLLEDRLVRSDALIEDELLLAVPPIPRHPEGTCAPPPTPDDGGEPQQQHEEGSRPNPFAQLTALKRRRDD
jgi:uncharacterized protein